MTPRTSTTEGGGKPEPGGCGGVGIELIAATPTTKRTNTKITIATIAPGGNVGDGDSGGTEGDTGMPGGDENESGGGAVAGTLGGRSRTHHWQTVAAAEFGPPHLSQVRDSTIGGTS